MTIEIKHYEVYLDVIMRDCMSRMLTLEPGYRLYSSEYYLDPVKGMVIFKFTLEAPDVPAAPKENAPPGDPKIP